MSLLVEIPTKNRPRILGRCLAALLAQSYQDWDLLIVNDNPHIPIESDPVTKEWLERHRMRRMVWTETGLGTGQVFAHNLALWKRPWRSYDLILRLDDDMLLNSLAIQQMKDVLLADEKIGGVTGLWFEHEVNSTWFSDRDVPTREEWDDSIELDGKVVEGVISNWHQRLYHDLRRPTLGRMYVEHMYSAAMYRAEEMRRVGGWPEIYSQGVHHGEETDGSFRLNILRRLVVIPQVTGQHLRSGGGIRSTGIDVEHRQRMQDDPLRNQRLRDMPGEYEGKIKVGLWSQHALFAGGGPRLFFELLKALQDSDYIDVWPVGEHMDLDDVEETFGVELDDFGPQPEQVDVLIEMGDDIDWLDRARKRTDLPEANSKILFTFYPFGDRSPLPDEYCHVTTLSRFVVGEIGKRWGWDASYIYPVAKEIRHLKKKNWMLIVGRIDQWKGTLWLAEVFAELELEDWELHIVGATVGSSQVEYVDQVKSFADGHDSVFTHFDVSQTELEGFYGRAKILLAAKGLLADMDPDLSMEAEHYGLTPLEAMSTGCVPLVYDAGGHVETTPNGWRWNTREDLLSKLSETADGWDDIVAFPDRSEFYDHDLFKEKWERLVLQANAGTLSLVPTRESDVYLVDKPLKVAVITDAPPPRRYTGFGVVGGQIVPGFVDAGFDVYYYAILDDIPAKANEFPYTYWNMAPTDPQGEKNLIRFLMEVKPDVVWSLYDAGNLYKQFVFSELGLQARKPDGERIPTVIYFPVEGKPIPPTFGLTVEYAQRSGGSAWTYCESGANVFNEQFDPVKVDGFAHHGLDHADFRPYSEGDRKMLRRLVGLDDKFVVGSFGVNKRVKQFDLLIQAAVYLKKWKVDDVIFYLHTEPDNPILQGYPLKGLAEYYGVADMFIWKPDTYHQRGGKYRGAEYTGNTLEQAKRMTTPPTAQERGFFFGHFDLVSRYNCLDLYIDCSSVEGWNLPLGEAMRCGVPALSVDDSMVRSEIYGKAAYMLEPYSRATWHNGVELQVVDPIRVAGVIHSLLEHRGMREKYSVAGLKAMEAYKWKDCRDTMVRAVKDAVGYA